MAKTTVQEVELEGISDLQEEAKTESKDAVAPDILAAILTEMQSIRAELAAKDEENAILQGQVEQATALSQRVIDAARVPMATPSSWAEIRGDGPEKNIEVRLDAYERQAKEEQIPFDRDRARRSLLGLPVDPLVFGVCATCGTASATKPAFDKHQKKHELEAGRVIGKRR